MTTLNKIISLCALLVFSNVALGNSTGNKDHFKNMKKISLKCDVIFVGGKRSIRFHYNLPVKLRGSFEADLIQLSQSSRNKIYKVNECVETKKKFKDEIANRLEKELIF